MTAELTDHGGYTGRAGSLTHNVVLTLASCLPVGAPGTRTPRLRFTIKCWQSQHFFLKRPWLKLGGKIVVKGRGAAEFDQKQPLVLSILHHLRALRDMHAFKQSATLLSSGGGRASSQHHVRTHQKKHVLVWGYGFRLQL